MPRIIVMAVSEYILVTFIITFLFSVVFFYLGKVTERKIIRKELADLYKMAAGSCPDICCATKKEVK